MKPVNCNLGKTIARNSLVDFEKFSKNITKRIVVKDFIKDNRLVDRYLNTPLRQRAKLVKIEANIMEKIADELEKDFFNGKSLISTAFKNIKMAVTRTFQIKKARKQFLAKS